MIINRNGALWKLISKGIQTGLANGTMYIIYRLGTDQKISEVLDSIDIVTGSLERRIIVSDTIAEILNSGKYGSIISIAGGSSLLTIEAVAQSNLKSAEIYNLDIYKKAHDKALKCKRSNAKKTHNYKG